jgi:hypothetical protein
MAEENPDMTGKDPFRLALARLSIEANACYNALTPEGKRKHDRLQRRSWVIGETMLEHPEMTREQAELLYDHARNGD